MPMESRDGNLPDFLVIGALKCATTSLHYYLDLHPDIQMATPGLNKEVNFFIKELNWDRGVDWYRSKFTGAARAYGEVSPGYTAHPLFTGVPRRIHGLLPDVRLIYIVRDPFERIVSHYIQRREIRFESRDFETAVGENNFCNSYVDRSRYHMQIEHYLPYFSRSQIKIVDMADLRDRRAETLKDLFRFLGVREDYESSRFEEVRHRSAKKRQWTSTGQHIQQLVHAMGGRFLPQKVRDSLGVLYRPFTRPIERPEFSDAFRREVHEVLNPDTEAFRAFSGKAFSGW